MALLQLNLKNVRDNGNTPQRTISTFEVVGYNNQEYHVYVSGSYELSAVPTSWNLTKLRAINTQTFDTPLSNPKHFYFYLAFDEDRGSNIVVNDPGTSGYDEMEYIIQGRMDTGTIVVEDDNNILSSSHTDKLLADPRMNTNDNGCCTFTLPDVDALPKSAEPEDNMVYMLAYDNGNNKTMVQGAICTKNDNRFHAYVGEEDRVVVRRLGIELFTSKYLTSSLVNVTNHTVLIYGFKVSEVPELFYPLFPHFFDKNK